MKSETLQRSAAALCVTGDVPNALSLDLAQLEALPHHALGPIDIACMTGRPVAHVDRYAGVRLTDVLDATGLAQLHRSELKRCIVVASGRDGYQALFSWCELYNSPIGAQALILFERNGEPLDDHLGPLALISAADTHLGPRHLRHLDGLAVRRL
ncbi:molybdopterin-dependent oxidoreductase [Paucibacter sp. R3-3]|uniref:Molybdopterin-dependent oxidoreductase n=1 Tax=Roseateles agri TaxID=3098619 RepID=A0ABU5DED8_9BURK|nr:molybdopterin-dependent oxidoreductase [Paucibacter sp. R3-3]MDY0744649.1 molybdopterin-dependent oxidoreductase [Paucibacter sp. R3-3]